MKLVYVALFLVVESQAKSEIAKCFDPADFTRKIVRSEELVGDWMMAHIHPLYRDGFRCPAPKLKVAPITQDDINFWKNKCLHKLDISILDEKKFELKVVFPDDFEERFSIILREGHRDRLLFPSCVFGRLDFLRDSGENKMWIATREKDGIRLPVAVSVPMWERTRCVANPGDNHVYYFC